MVDIGIFLGLHGGVVPRILVVLCDGSNSVQARCQLIQLSKKKRKGLHHGNARNYLQCEELIRFVLVEAMSSGENSKLTKEMQRMKGMVTRRAKWE